jgi:nucleoside-diphosphate-sugar epimerase
MKKVLVTGANGFIGSNLCRRLLSEGYAVRALVRKSSDLQFLEGTKVTLLYGDITLPETLKAAVDGVEKVFHVAGLAADWGPFSLFERINFRGTQNVARAAAEAGVKRFIYVSTVAFHGFGKQNITEDDPPAENLIPYAQTKLMAERWLWEFAKESPMQITAVRPGNVFGVNDRTFLFKYIDALLQGKFAEINHGKSKTCPVYVENLIDIMMTVAVEPQAAGNAYLATDGLDITWHEFNSALAAALGVPMPKTSIPYPFAMAAAKVYYRLHKLLGLKSEPFLTPYRINNGGKDYHFSIQKLKDHFGYSPAVHLEEGLKRTVESYFRWKK